MKDDPFLEMIGLPHTIKRNGPSDVYHTTGFTRAEVTEIAVMINAVELDPEIGWPPILGLFRSVVATLTYMRRNRVQAEIGEDFGVSQPTISRTIKVMTPLIETALAGFVPTADELDENAQYIIDGTLLPCWSWAACPELYSGKHMTAVVNMNAGGGQAG